MLELRPTCENCNSLLPPNSPEAMICSFECTLPQPRVSGRIHALIRLSMRENNMAQIPVSDPRLVPGMNLPSYICEYQRPSRKG
jgi:hypothetical protein